MAAEVRGALPSGTGWMARQAVGRQLTWSQGSPRSSHWHLALAMDTLISAPALAASKSMNPSIAAAACADEATARFALSVLCRRQCVAAGWQLASSSGRRPPQTRRPIRAGAGMLLRLSLASPRPGLRMLGSLSGAANAKAANSRDSCRSSAFQWPDCRGAAPSRPRAAPKATRPRARVFVGRAAAGALAPPSLPIERERAGRLCAGTSGLARKRLRAAPEATSSGAGPRPRAPCAGWGDASLSASSCLWLPPCRLGT